MLFKGLLAALPLAAASPLARPETAAAPASKYIVVLKGDAQAPQVSSQGKLPSIQGGVAFGAAVASIEKQDVYGMNNFKGFSASLNDAELEALKADPSVAYVAEDGEMHISLMPRGPRRSLLKRDTVTQSDVPSWGLARVSSQEPGTTDYTYDESAGEGTCAYIVDTGIWAEHPDFEGRAKQIKNFASNATADDNGHGTHCAGTIGSKSYGIAKKASLFGVKVLDAEGSGTFNDIIKGIEFAVSDSKEQDCPNGVVISMSLGGSKSQAVNDAVAAAVDEGVFVAVAAGNEAADASESSPASEPKAFTVGASDDTDAMADFSNFGEMVDITAPGVDITSTWIDDGKDTISGTSMATPHVAGMAAYLLGLTPGMSPEELGKKLVSLAVKDALEFTSAQKGTVNLLLNNGLGGGNSTSLF